MVEIPDKMFFRIGDVSRITGIKPYVLRYWESEFKLLKPIKNKAGQRIYRRKDVKLIIEIKSLLYDQKFTIAGAKKKILDDNRRTRDRMEEVEGVELLGVLRKVQEELVSIRDILK